MPFGDRIAPRRRETGRSTSPRFEETRPGGLAVHLPPGRSGPAGAGSERA